jgi:hypothetical protein
MPRNDEKFYVERRPAGDYAARKSGSQRASFTGETQGEAAKNAHKSAPAAIVLGERVRNTKHAGRDKWRRLF